MRHNQFAAQQWSHIKKEQLKHNEVQHATQPERPLSAPQNSINNMSETRLIWVMHNIRRLSAMQAQESSDFTSSSSELRLAHPAEEPLGPQNPPLHRHFHTSIRHFSNQLWSAWGNPEVLRVEKKPIYDGQQFSSSALPAWFSRQEACGRCRCIPPPPER